MAVKSLSRSGLQASDATNSMLAAYSVSDFELVQTVSLSVNTTSITLDVSSLAGVYKHLQLRISARSASGNANVHMRFNNDSTTNNYSYHEIYGYSTTTGSTGNANTGKIPAICGMPPSASHFASSIVEIYDPFSSVKNKTLKMFKGISDLPNGITGVGMNSSGWFSTSPITSLNIFGDYDIGAFSKFSLYGVRG